MRKARLAVSILSLVLLLTACAPQAVPAPAPVPVVPAPAAAPLAPSPAAPVKVAWEVEWERTLEVARREGLVTYAISSGRDVQIGLTQSFRDKFGIRAEAITGTGGGLASKILAERRAGLYLWDIFVDGSGALTTTLKRGGGSVPLEPVLILPDLTDPEVIKTVWHGGKLPWVDQEHHMIGAVLYVPLVFAINTNLVKPGEIKTWDDLHDPKWKGKILFMNPTIAGNVSATTMPMLYEVKGEAWVRRLAGQEPTMIGDDRLAVEWLAHGKYPIYIVPRAESFRAFVDVGAPVAAVVTEDVAAVSSGTSVVALIGKASHPNAAKLLINYYLSKEGQTVVSKALQQPSARLDVSREGLMAWSVPQPGRDYWMKDREEVLLKIDDYTKKSTDIFRPLLK